MLATGTYHATVEKTWFTTSQAGTPGLCVKVSIEDEWDKDVSLIGTIWLSEKAMPMARRQLRALGFDPDANDLDAIGDTIDLVGNKVDVQLKEESYKGRTELRISMFGGNAPPPSKQALSAASAALRAAKKKPDAANPEPEAPPAKVEPPAEDDGGEIPF